jgi:hypothetical protein
MNKLNTSVKAMYEYNLKLIEKLNQIKQSYLIVWRL